MQKSNKKKLVLAPTTLRPLTDGELVRTAGGYSRYCLYDPPFAIPTGGASLVNQAC